MTSTAPSKRYALGRTPDSSLRRARDILVRAARNPGSVSAEEIDAAAHWILATSAGIYHAKPVDLRALIAQRGMTNAALIRELGVHHSTFHNWLSGKKRPSKQMIERLAAILKVPRLRLTQAIASVRGASPSPSFFREYAPDTTLTGQNFAAARRKVGLTQTQLAERAGLSGHTLVSALETGRRVPSKHRKALQDALRKELGKLGKTAARKAKVSGGAGE